VAASWWSRRTSSADDRSLRKVTAPLACDGLATAFIPAKGRSRANRSSGDATASIGITASVSGMRSVGARRVASALAVSLSTNASWSGVQCGSIIAAKMTSLMSASGCSGGSGQRPNRSSKCWPAMRWLNARVGGARRRKSAQPMSDRRTSPPSRSSGWAMVDTGDDGIGRSRMMRP